MTTLSKDSVDPDETDMAAAHQALPQTKAYLARHTKDREVTLLVEDAGQADRGVVGQPVALDGQIDVRARLVRALGPRAEKHELADFWEAFRRIDDERDVAVPQPGPGKVVHRSSRAFALKVSCRALRRG